MKAKELQELIDFIAKSGLNKVDIETEEFKISVKREPDSPKVHYVPEPPRAASPIAPVPATTPPVPAPVTAAPTPASTTGSDSNYITLKSPMIGTFYRSSSPDSAFFVNVGDEISKGDVICIIEAMKLFNEIEAEYSGKIVKVLVENASPVEYDQPLFLIDPS
ncbi:acetyl-CoA carboxylase biotin carboxyl carrier protein [Adhaeribacter pallidiroseus]|uniref:Biotin carboxyl carrier protein of acetyl-CoA carboxylase n=1 Tax=Adhaeribacter pallidiroseus TaxID=2072847 RepID=A0A369QHF4_9BACT|nr:acetyl-CoA carboxylase biotin carboxyl carrier protein [Adhaeribacter pallidiroseus]RDC63005.1 Biotin carboxyl carrier protein of acetyl-CoA carboxylase 1, chloroplastic [Adhaeribacter pallidiroseus]